MAHSPGYRRTVFFLVLAVLSLIFYRAPIVEAVDVVTISLDAAAINGSAMEGRELQGGGRKVMKLRQLFRVIGPKEGDSLSCDFKP